MNRAQTFQLFAGGTLSPLLLSLLLVLPTAARPPVPEESLSLQELIDLPEEDLAMIDIAAVNLACAEGLPGSENIDRKALLAKLDRWAQHVAYETTRHLYRFEQDPEEYHHSFAEFAMLMMANVVQQDFGVRYNPSQITPADDPTGFDFTRSQDLFINGLLEGTGGTCASMPVLYIALGRRLGYPLKLVFRPEHSFLRWDDPVTGERVNMEGTSRGYADYSDEYYEQWPRPIDPIARERGNFLKSLTPREELSVFLTSRGDSLLHSRRVHDAHRSYRAATQLAPKNYSAKMFLKQTTELIASANALIHAEAAFRLNERLRRTDPRMMIPGMPSIPTALAVNGRRPGNGLPALLQQFPHLIAPGLPRSLIHTNPDGTGFQLPTMQEDLNETNRRNQQLMRFGRPRTNRLIHGAVPMAPIPRAPNYERKP